MPPGIVGWIPPGVLHATPDHREIAGWAGYLAPERCSGLPVRACGLGCSSLVPLIIKRLVEVNLPPPNRCHLLSVLLDELAVAEPVSRHLPVPRGVQLSPVVRALTADPGDSRSAREWAALAGMSERNFSRTFAREAGMSFVRWRRLARLMRGYELLAEGCAVQEVAWEVGYGNVSAFIAGFRETFGVTPATVAGLRRGASYSK